MEIIKPESEAAWLELRTKDITSTEVAALFGISSAGYIPTLFELWHRKKDAISVALEPNDRMQWGNRLQDAIAFGVAADNNWKIRRKDEYIRNPSLRMGASFDYHVFNPEGGDPRGDFLLEVKNVDALQFRDGWVVNKEDDGTVHIEAPHHIEIQVQHQLAVSYMPKAYIAALVGGNRVILIERTPDEKIIAAIKERVAAFWASIDANEPPAPDFKLDADFIRTLFQAVEPGEVFDAQGNTDILSKMMAYKDIGEQMKRLDQQKDEIKAEILATVGTAEKVVGDGFSISLGVVAGGPVSYIRESYRNFRPYFKKPKP